MLIFRKIILNPPGHQEVVPRVLLYLIHGADMFDHRKVKEAGTGLVTES